MKGNSTYIICGFISNSGNQLKYEQIKMELSISSENKQNIKKLLQKGVWKLNYLENMKSTRFT